MNDYPEVLIDEVIWQKWVDKNDAMDKFRFKRRVLILVTVLPILAVAAVAWRFTL